MQARTPGSSMAARAARRAALSVALALLSAAPAPAQEADVPGPVEQETVTAPPPETLAVAILDLADIPELAPPPAAQRPAWRTSFGSERATLPEPKRLQAGEGALASLAAADAVLIHGVRAAAPLRRLFPRRAWRLTVARPAVAPEDAATAPREAVPATAIAIRARPGLRITARSYALRLGASEADPAVASAPATAVRLAAPGRALWLAAVALPPSCATAASCPARQDLEAWRAARRADGETTLVGGRGLGATAAGAAPGAPPPCAVYGLQSDLAAAPSPPPAGVSPAAETGCMVIIRLGP